MIVADPTASANVLATSEFSGAQALLPQISLIK
jgi:hypothetical protein